jgi:hypothetical protein
MSPSLGQATLSLASRAPVAQRIEHRPPEAGAQVRFLPGAPTPPAYTEVLTRSTGDPNHWFSGYVVKIDDNTLAAAVCWGQQFDAVFQQLNDPRFGSIYVDEFRKIYPTFFSLIDNAVDERYGDGALTELIDLDDMNRKWFFAKLINVTARGGGAGADLAVRNAVDEVIALALAAAREFQTDLSWKAKLRIGARGGAVGYKEGAAISDRWGKRLNWLQALLPH